MNEKKKAQILMLALAVVILAAAGAGWYWLGARPKANGNGGAEVERRAQNPSMAGEAGVTAGGRAGEAGLEAGLGSGGTMGENGNLERSGEPGEIRDGLIFLEGGTFVMGSPEGGASEGAG